MTDDATVHTIGTQTGSGATVGSQGPVNPAPGPAPGQTASPARPPNNLSHWRYIKEVGGSGTTINLVNVCEIYQYQAVDEKEQPMLDHTGKQISVTRIEFLNGKYVDTYMLPVEVFRA
jgi:hypothetical protein